MSDRVSHHVLVRALIVIGVAAIPTLANIAYTSWLWANAPGDSSLVPTTVRILVWPVGTVVCKDIFTAFHVGDKIFALQRCLLAVTWLKYVGAIVLMDWASRWRALNWLVPSRRAILVACLNPCLFVLLLEANGAMYRMSDILWAPVVVLLAVANALALFGIAGLRCSRLARVVCSLPFWLAWIWWWSDLRFHVFSDSFYTMDVIRVLVPLLGFVLYAVTLDNKVAERSETA